MSEKKPYIGAIVHFINANNLHRPAIIVDIHDDRAIDIQVFGSPIIGEPSIEFVTWVYLDSSTNPVYVHSWHWPEELNS